MSDASTLQVGLRMSETGQPLPTTTMQLAGHATGAVVEGLTSSTRAPWMLGVIILNSIGIAAAVYFLNVLIQGQQIHLNHLIEMQQQQRQELIRMHKEEFDALLDIAKSNFTLALQSAQMQPAPARPPEPPGRRPQ